MGKTKSYTKLYQDIISAHSFIPYHIFRNKAFLPIQIFLEVTYRCNLQCSICQFLPLITSDSGKLEENELSSSELIKVIDSIPKWALITITGGEPFIRKDIMDVLIYASQRHKVHIITNGTLLTDEMLQQLVQLGSKSILGNGLIMIGISIEGREYIHEMITGKRGTFNRTINTITRLGVLKREMSKSFPLVNLATVLTEENLNDIPLLMEVAADLHVNIYSLIARNIFPHYKRLDADSNESLFKEIPPTEINRRIFIQKVKTAIDVAKKRGLEVRLSPHGVKTIYHLLGFYTHHNDLKRFFTCHAPWSKAVISSKGDVMICPNYSIGNIKEYPLSTLWNNKISREFRSRLKKEKIFGHCWGCCMIEEVNGSNY